MQRGFKYKAAFWKKTKKNKKQKTFLYSCYQWRETEWKISEMPQKTKMREKIRNKSWESILKADLHLTTAFRKGSFSLVEIKYSKEKNCEQLRKG